MLKVGSRGTDVVKLQKALKAAGLNVGTADGKFGAKTKAAVKAYQRAHGLGDDGVVGNKTGSKILRTRNADAWDGVSDRRGGRAPAGNSGGAGTPTPAVDTGRTTSVNGVPVSAKMRKFAGDAKQTALGMNGYRGRGECAKGVNRSILKTFGFRNYGNGNQIDNNLPRSKFRQVNMSLADALKVPGLVLTWEKTATRMGQRYGHTAVTLGDGKSSASDFVERNTLNVAGRTGFKVFMPIS